MLGRRVCVFGRVITAVPEPGPPSPPLCGSFAACIGRAKAEKSAGPDPAPRRGSARPRRPLRRKDRRRNLSVTAAILVLDIDIPPHEFGQGRNTSEQRARPARKREMCRRQNPPIQPTILILAPVRSRSHSIVVQRMARHTEVMPRAHAYLLKNASYVRRLERIAIRRKHLIEIGSRSTSWRKSSSKNSAAFLGTCSRSPTPTLRSWASGSSRHTKSKFSIG